MLDDQDEQQKEQTKDSQHITMYCTRNILLSTKTQNCCDASHSKNRVAFCLFIILIVLAKLCNTENLSPQQTKHPRRHVRIVIRNSPITRSTDNILMRYARERDRTLVRVIRTKRRKRNKDVLHIAPTHMRTVRLKSKTGFFLEIQPSGKVTGHVNKTKYTKMELQVITPHVKRIKSVATGRYLAINRKGKVISKGVSDNETYFFEELSENYDYLYCSIKYPKTDSGLSWYVGLKRSRSRKTLQGRAKRASRTLPGDSATHFSIFFEH